MSNRGRGGRTPGGAVQWTHDADCRRGDHDGPCFWPGDPARRFYCYTQGHGDPDRCTEHGDIDRSLSIKDHVADKHGMTYDEYKAQRPPDAPDHITGYRGMLVASVDDPPRDEDPDDDIAAGDAWLAREQDPGTVALAQASYLRSIAVTLHRLAREEDE